MIQKLSDYSGFDIEDIEYYFDKHPEQVLTEDNMPYFAYELEMYFEENPMYVTCDECNGEGTLTDLIGDMFIKRITCHKCKGHKEVEKC